jgi:RHH-type proline utilization regulon transcriptional repressor/proline dehydrogenase/delta 1-pyrroline-5-carboxylate dehydrogenase
MDSSGHSGTSGEREREILATGREILRRMEGQAPAYFDRSRWTGRLMEAAMESPDFKTRLFRFIDVLPALTSAEQVSDRLREYFLAEDASSPGFLKVLLRGMIAAPAAFATAFLVRRNVAAFSRNFIAGATPGNALPALRRLRSEGKTFTIDLLGEAVVSEREADDCAQRYLALVDTLSREVACWPALDPAREAQSPLLNVSIKISSLYSLAGPVNHEESIRRVCARLVPVFRKVREAGGAVCLDMETRLLKEVTLDLFTRMTGAPEFLGWEHAGIALQTYLRDAEQDVRRMIRWARERGSRLTLRLVKGAYWEHERIAAAQKGWPAPVFSRKSETDACYERCARIVLENHDIVSLAAATHNVRTQSSVLAAARRVEVPSGRWEFQMLYGMAEPVKKALIEMGHPVREYVPVGDLLPGMAYLVRRLLENTSNEGFLRRVFLAGAPPEELLAAPVANGEEREVRPAGEGAPFRNEPPTDFSIRGNREAFRDAVANARAEARRAGKDVPAVIGGKEIRTEERIASVNPAHPEEVVCTAFGLTTDLVAKAVAAARAAQEAWGNVPPASRAQALFRAAEVARHRRAELAAWQVVEVGKGWAEADADVVEAIDYLEYYGREMVRLGKPVPMGAVPGEENIYLYRPRGVGVVIAPWNFPLAISIGMTAAALVTGNAVLYKPSSLSPINGWLAYSLFREAGIPDGVLNFVPARGSVVGDLLVEHRDVDFVLFTGSLEVGMRISERCGKTPAGQRMFKRAIIETGGKNAIIVDEDADLDQAVPAIVCSSLGYQGQKCSACSRAIVLPGIHDAFVSRLADAVRGLSVGPPEDPANFVGPVIDLAAKQRILGFIEAGRSEGRVIAQVPPPLPEDGFYVPPTVLTDLPPASRILTEEIFGPVLAVIRARDLGSAIEEANRTPFALTGGVFSRSPAAIERVRREFVAGNLYINRGITGAIVGRQPFGGFRLSGVGSKAGGPDYLLQFMTPVAISENTIRRGFSPEELAASG